MAIKVLSKQVAELIAAGEAVERPASVVKELIENSIDAGAKNITVEIKNGGTSYIRITDNGCGIAYQEVPTAFLRHATSKVSTQEDLQKIGTLGFRGEALASVCAVAKVQMLTSTGNSVGCEYTIEGGEQISYSESGCPKGTTIIVRDLFYNTPARMKFLKTDLGEGNAVAGVVDKIALSHPEIAFKFIRDSKQVLSTPGNNDLSSAVYAVYGNQFVKDSINIDYNNKGIRIYGLVSKPSASRKSRAMQFFYINGRYIRSSVLSKAIETAYKNSIMVGRFAACILFIDMPSSVVDINVHPSKLECRFADEKTIFEAVYFAVKSAVENADSKQEIKLASNPYVTRKPVDEGEQIGLHNIAKPKSATPSRNEIEQYLNILKSAKAETKPTIVLNQPKTEIEYKKSVLDKILDESEKEDKPVKAEKPAKTQQPPQIPQPQKEDCPIVDNEVDIKLLGEVFNTYIICECGKELIIIDKHAAHERMIYENIKNRKYTYAQPLITPQSVTLSKEECDVITANLDKLTQIGFEIEYFGSSNVLVRSVPMIISDCDINSIIEEIADGFLQKANKVEIEQMDWLYHSMSCRAAIKGGDINGEDLMVIARRVAQTGDIKYCPHGRPVAYKLTKKELDKQFGRLG